MIDAPHRDIIANDSAFTGLSANALDALAAVSVRQTLAVGDMMLQEGAQDKDLVLLVSGTAVAFRKASDGTEVELNNIVEGDCIGELSLFDAGRRAASVRASTRCTILRIKTGDIDDPAVLSELRVALATTVVRRARMLSDKMLESLRGQLAARELQNQFGHFLIFTIAIFLLATMIFYLVAEDYVEDVYEPGFSWQTVVVFALPCLVIIRALRIPLHELGIRREGLWRSTWQAVVFSAVLSSPAIIWIIFFRDPIPAAERPVQITTLFVLQYLAHCIFQEIGARGLIQGLFQKFLDDRRGHRSVLLSSTIFASLHVALGADAVVLTFFAGIIFGYAYLWQKNLAGVIIIHFWFGQLAAFMVAL